MSIARTLPCLKPNVWELLKRFRELVKQYHDSMNKEFRPNPFSCAEWLVYMQDLQWALAFVFKEFDVIDRSDMQDQLLKSLDDLMVACDERIMNAKKHLESAALGSSASKITNAREELEALLFTLKELDTGSMAEQNEGTPVAVSLDDEGYALKNYEDSFYVWVDYLEGRIQRSQVLEKLKLPSPEADQEQPDELDLVCIISRCVYLRAVLFAYVSPLEWVGGTRLHALLKIQERVRREKLYAPTPHRYNVSSRLREIKKSKLLTGQCG